MTILRTILFTLSFIVLSASVRAQEKSASRRTHAAPPQRPSVTMRELGWETYLDKVQGAWMGKMIGVTFGQPWEFNYLGAPIGFDITDWTLSPTRMKDYRARMDNKTDYEGPVIREAHSSQVHINKGFIEASEKGASQLRCTR
jgi:hypothetical protein